MIILCTIYNCDNYYRVFRIRQTGLNLQNTNELSISGFEITGTMVQETTHFTGCKLQKKNNDGDNNSKGLMSWLSSNCDDNFDQSDENNKLDKINNWVTWRNDKKKGNNGILGNHISGLEVDISGDEDASDNSTRFSKTQVVLKDILIIPTHVRFQFDSNCIKMLNEWHLAFRLLYHNNYHNAHFSTSTVYSSEDINADEDSDRFYGTSTCTLDFDTTHIQACDTFNIYTKWSLKSKTKANDVANNYLKINNFEMFGAVIKRSESLNKALIECDLPEWDLIEWDLPEWDLKKWELKKWDLKQWELRVEMVSNLHINFFFQITAHSFGKYQ